MKSVVSGLILIFLAPLPAFAQAGSGGKGGDAVVCFDRNVRGVYGVADLLDADGTITDEGRTHAISAHSREHWQIMKQGERSRFLETLIGLSYEQALEKIIERFNDFPVFSERLREDNEELKSFGRGPRLTSVEDIKDTGVSFRVPPHCTIVQAVIREEDLFRTNETATDQLLKVGVNAAMMQFHEVVYNYGVRVGSHADSRPTELLLIAALGNDLSTLELGRRMLKYGFPTAILQNSSRDPMVTRELPLTRETIAVSANEAVGRLLKLLEDTGALIGAPPSSCNFRGTATPVPYWQNTPFSYRQFLPFDPIVLPKKLLVPGETLQTTVANAVSSMNVRVIPQSDGVNCQYTGNRLTPVAKAAIQRGLAEFLRALERKNQ